MTTPSGEFPATGSPEPADAPIADHVVTRSRLGTVWAAAVGFAVVLLLLLIFILENGARADVAFFGVHAHLPLGVALLLAAVFGILLVVIPGIGRMAQLRLTARRHRRLDTGASGATGTPGTPGTTGAPSAPTTPATPSTPTAPTEPGAAPDDVV